MRPKRLPFLCSEGKSVRFSLDKICGAWYDLHTTKGSSQRDKFARHTPTILEVFTFWLCLK